MKVVIDKEVELAKLNEMLDTLTDEKDKQSVRFAINLISGFKERPTGEWTEEKLSNGWREFLCAKCSNCGESFTVHECDLEVFRKDYSFCPNCGASMKGEEDEDKK